MFSRLTLPLLTLGLLSSCSTVSPLAPGAKAVDHGKIGAGEGPAWRDGVLYFTDGRGINQFNPATSKSGVYRANCGSPNGLMFDAEKRMIRCESGGRRVVREEADGSLTVLADRYEGHRFNTPNDLAMDSQGAVYFTDPRYGDRSGMEIKDAKGRLVEGVYRINRPATPLTDTTLPVTLILGPDDVERPNGILITPDDRHLYVADNNNNTHGGSRRLLRFDLDKNGTVTPGSRKVIFDWKNSRGPDGIKMDARSRLYVAAGVNNANPYETTAFKAGCYILSPQGKLIDFVPTAPDEATNCAFGGEDKRTLYMTSGNHLWSVPLKK